MMKKYPAAARITSVTIAAGQNRDQPGDNHCQRIAFFHHIGQLEVVPTGAITLARFVLFPLELARALEFALEQDHSSG